MGITIDLDKCKKDAFCANVCPAGVIKMDGPDGSPQQTEDFEEICIKCGHCLAVCPHGALTWNGVAPEDCPPIVKDLKISREQAVQFLLGRRSIRCYQEDELPREQLEAIIEVARQAPSGHNSQPLEWMVFSGRDKMKELANLVAAWMEYVIDNHPKLAEALHMPRTLENYRQGHDRLLRGAPHLMIVHAHKENRFAPPAGAIAMTYVELTAYAMGLGACWAGYFNTAAQTFPPMKEVLGLPEGHTTVGSIMVGKPLYKYKRVPPRNPARVTWR